MKNLDDFKFINNEIKNKERFFKRNKIEEKNLTEDEKFLIEIKWALAIWHTKEEIINWMKNENSVEKITVFFKKERNRRKKNKKLEKAFKTEAKLLVKEMLKDVNDKDHLILTFENLERNLVVFPTKMRDKWDNLVINETYKLAIVKQSETKWEKDVLIGFKNIKNF